MRSYIHTGQSYRSLCYQGTWSTHQVHRTIIATICGEMRPCCWKLTLTFTYNADVIHQYIRIIRVHGLDTQASPWTPKVSLKDVCGEVKIYNHTALEQFLSVSFKKCCIYRLLTRPGPCKPLGLHGYLQRVAGWGYARGCRNAGCKSKKSPHQKHRKCGTTGVFDIESPE